MECGFEKNLSDILLVLTLDAKKMYLWPYMWLEVYRILREPENLHLSSQKIPFIRVDSGRPGTLELSSGMDPLVEVE